MIMKWNSIHKLFLLLGLIAFVLQACKKDGLNSRLVAQFKAEKENILAGETVLFTDISEGQPSSWNWTFDGGQPSTSNLSGPSVTYAKPGTYAVTLEIKNGVSSVIEKKTGYIVVGYHGVAAEFEASAASIVQDESISFTDKSSGMPTIWAWEFKSGSTVLTSQDQNPIVKFTIPGVYTVSLMVTNPKGTNTVTKDEFVTVVDKNSVEANFEADQTATYSGGSIKFRDKSVGLATIWNWSFEGAEQTSSNEQHPTVKYTSAGRFKVKLVASNVARTSTIEKESYILVVPGDGLTAFYPLNGSINDYGPNRLISTSVGTVKFAELDRKALAGNTGVFNGTGGFIVPDHEAMNFGTGNYTVSCWMRTAASTSGMIWQESGAKAAGDNQTWLRIRGSATNLTSFSTEDQTGGSSINLTTANSGAKAITNDNRWHHIVCVRQGVNTKMYIDGELIREANSSTGIKVTSNDGSFKVGMQENASGYLNKFNGLIDDLIIYKRALTQAEIAELKNL